MMGSFRRPRFMSSPVLTDLARFHASSPTLQLSNTSVWNSVQTAVIKVFHGGGLQANELYTLNESIRWLLKTELGSFIMEYFQNQPLNKGLSYILESIQLYGGENYLQTLSEMWVRFFTEILPTLQAIFYPVQGQEMTVRQMILLSFRDVVLLKLPLEDHLHTSPLPPAIPQMLLVLQGVHEPNGPTEQYYLLERLVEMVVSPYLGNYRYQSPKDCSPEYCLVHSGLAGMTPFSQPEITVTQFATDSLLAPLVEQEGEAYLEKVGGVRRHTVANVHSDIQLLSTSNRICPGKAEKNRRSKSTKTARNGGSSTFSSELDVLETSSALSEFSRKQSSAKIS
ncbi:proline-rich protein 5-like [Chanos chanos]|uniref:Proline-rich protein 5-like n=1 Tax=Chanos chanos TaxID=29144 RepID=A0A6J2UPD5_CHACN|nr:proline-rich protein 5-like [Chanos chanos]